MRCRLWVSLARQHQLFPQPAAVLSGELLRHLVDGSEPFHSDDERLVGGEASGHQVVDLAPEVHLQLLDVASVEPWAPLQVSAPLGDLELELVHRQGLPDASVGRAPPQASLNVWATATHCRLCSSKAARPSSVMA